MKFFDPKLQSLRHVFKTRRKFEANDYMNPLRDWAWGLISATTVFCIGIGLITFDYYKEFVIPQSEVEIETQSISYPRSDVLQYAELYRAQENDFAALRNARQLKKLEVSVPIPETSSTTSAADDLIPTATVTTASEVLLTEPDSGVQ